MSAIDFSKLCLECKYFIYYDPGIVCSFCDGNTDRTLVYVRDHDYGHPARHSQTRSMKNGMICEECIAAARLQIVMCRGGTMYAHSLYTFERSISCVKNARSK